MSDNPLSQNIAKYRKAAGLTQEDLGRLLNVSMQAVSRWERGGAPDLSLLPELAQALGITIDQLFNFTSSKPLDPATFLRKELCRIPEEQRFVRAYELALELIELIVDINDGGSEHLYRYLKLNERVDRKQRLASPLPSLLSVSTDEGIMKASLAADFQYVLMMPEPEDGFSSIMKNERAYLRLFALLEKPHRLRALYYAHTRHDRPFSATLLGKEVDISEAEAEEILSELSEHRLLQKGQVDTADGPLNTYTLRVSSALIPFLYFGAEVMHGKNQHTLVIPVRKKPLVSGQIGEGSLFPNWTTSQVDAVEEAGETYNTTRSPMSVR